MTSIVTVCAVLCRCVVWLPTPTMGTVFGATAAVACFRERDGNTRSHRLHLVRKGHTHGELCLHELRTRSRPAPASGFPGFQDREGVGLHAPRVDRRRVPGADTQISGETTPEPAVNHQAEVATSLITRFETSPGSHRLREGCTVANLSMMLAGVLQTRRTTR